MERQRVAIAFMIVSCLGIIITTVGSFVALGVNQGGTAFSVLNTAAICFIMLFFIVIAVFEQDFYNDKQNQSQAEPDSSLI